MARLAAWVAPVGYRDALVGDLVERFQRDLTGSGAWRAWRSLLFEIAITLPALVRWRLTREASMEGSGTFRDPFEMQGLTAGATATRAVRLFRSFYLQALCVFLLIHFPLRIVGHFLRSDPSVGGALGSVMAQALLANGVLLISWTLVEGTLLSILVHRRRGEEIGIRRALVESARTLPRFLAARVLFLAGVVVGSALLVVPGILFACLFMLHGWLIFDRGLGPVEALAESARRVRVRLRQIVGVSLPVAGLTLVWVVVGVVFVAVTLRATAPHMPIFKIAPFTMTLMETGFVLFTILTGIVYANTARLARPS